MTSIYLLPDDSDSDGDDDDSCEVRENACFHCALIGGCFADATKH